MLHGPCRLHFKVPDVLLLAATAPLSKAVAMELCYVLPGQTGAQVQTINILAHNIGQLAKPLQGHQNLQTNDPNRSNKPTALEIVLQININPVG